MSDKEFEILMAQMNGHNDPEALKRLLEDPEACRRLDQLNSDLARIDEALAQTDLPDDYSQQLWLKIAPRLQTIEAPGWRQRLHEWLQVPRFSLAAMAVVLLAVILTQRVMLPAERDPALDFTAVQQRIVSENVQWHLSQSEVLLMQISNGDAGLDGDVLSQRAQQLLISNRMYRRLLADGSAPHVQQTLTELEPVLLELANQGGNNGTTLRQPIRNFTNNTLLFQVKSLNRRLAKTDEVI